MANPNTTISLGVAGPEDLYPLAALENKVYYPEKFDMVAFGPLRDHPSNIALRAQALAKPDPKSRKGRIVKAVTSEGEIVGLTQWSWNFVGWVVVGGTGVERRNRDAVVVSLWRGAGGGEERIGSEDESRSSSGSSIEGSRSSSASMLPSRSGSWEEDSRLLFGNGSSIL